jgi:hypothetical protein
LLERIVWVFHSCATWSSSCWIKCMKQNRRQSRCSSRHRDHNPAFLGITLSTIEWNFSSNETTLLQCAGLTPIFHRHRSSVAKTELSSIAVQSISSKEWLQKSQMCIFRPQITTNDTWCSWRAQELAIISWDKGANSCMPRVVKP